MIKVSVRMLRKKIVAAAFTTPLLAGLIGVNPLQAEPNRVTFPNIDALVHYTTVKRGVVTEHIMTTPAAMAAIKARQPMPAGTHVVLVDYRDGKVFRYFVMEKGEGWGRDYDDRRRTGDWQFQWFLPDRTVNPNENTARCQSCHQSQSGADYMFTVDRIPRFTGKPIE